MNPIDLKLNLLLNNEKTGAAPYSTYSLYAIRRILSYYGNPHRKIKTVHIAGTNGKGSVAFMLQSILISSGYSTGLYTSPHLLKINERIRIDRTDISTADLIHYLDELLTVADRQKLHPTYFDALTISAFRYFNDRGVDIAIIETGLGGRLDSTNVISPLACIITNISKDHLHLLGNTIGEITSEKAGIIKKHSPVISAAAGRISRGIISEKSMEHGSPYFFLGRDFFIRNIDTVRGGPLVFDFRFKDTVMKAININTSCRFQAVNAACAAACSLLLENNGFCVPERAIRRGLFAARIPGRFMLLSGSPVILFDPAHNPAAMKSLIASLSDRYPAYSFTAVVSFMRDKDYSSMLRIIMGKLTRSVLYFELGDERCMKPSSKEAEGKIPNSKNIKCFSDIHILADALKNEAVAGKIIVFTGSFRLYTIAKRISELLK